MAPSLAQTGAGLSNQTQQLTTHKLAPSSGASQSGFSRKALYTELKKKLEEEKIKGIWCDQGYQSENH